jgi:hypothetical protein
VSTEKQKVIFKGKQMPLLTEEDLASTNKRYGTVFVMLWMRPRQTLLNS